MCVCVGVASLTQEVLDEVCVGCERFCQVKLSVSAVLDLSQSVQVPQQDVAQPLGVYTRDPPLLRLLVLQPAWPGGGAHTHRHRLINLSVVADNHTQA